MKAIDLTGRKFGRLTAVEFCGTRNTGTGGASIRFWRCACECGNECEVSCGNLGHVQSCGCLQKERAGDASRSHGMAGTPEFNAWSHIRQRCYNPKNKSFKDYGDRGITVCERWLRSFENFMEDMGPRPAEKDSIDRIDNEGNYEPGNCRWADRDEQNSNTRQNRILTFSGKSMTVSQWARHMGVPDTILHKRTYRGWSPERVLTQPIRGYKNAHP